MLPRWAKLSTSSSALPSSLMGVVLTALTVSILLLPRWIFRPIFFQFSATFLLHLLLVVLEEVEVVRKVQVIKLSLKCSLYAILFLCCGCLHDPINGQQEQERRHQCSWEIKTGDVFS
jgi:hypothetical protein